MWFKDKDSLKTIYQIRKWINEQLWMKSLLTVTYTAEDWGDYYWQLFTMHITFIKYINKIKRWILRWKKSIS